MTSPALENDWKNDTGTDQIRYITKRCGEGMLFAPVAPAIATCQFRAAAWWSWSELIGVQNTPRRSGSQPCGPVTTSAAEIRRQCGSHHSSRSITSAFIGHVLWFQPTGLFHIAEWAGPRYSRCRRHLTHYPNVCFEQSGCCARYAAPAAIATPRRRSRRRCARQPGEPVNHLCKAATIRDRPPGCDHALSGRAAPFIRPRGDTGGPLRCRRIAPSVASKGCPQAPRRHPIASDYSRASTDHGHIQPQRQSLPTVAKPADAQSDCADQQGHSTARS